MSFSHPHLRTLEEIEQTCILGLMEVLREEVLQAVRYALWDMTSWHADYDTCVWRTGPPRSRRTPGGRCG